MTLTEAQTVALWAYVAVIAIWPIRLVVLASILKRQEYLTADSPRYEGDAPPLVTAIVPAKDEEKYLQGCLESVGRQSYPNLEIIVVDDRSTDQTGAIAERFAASDHRARVLAIDDLPPGWTGKTHALVRAVEHARGDWLWFLDADTLHAPDGLSILMEHGRRHSAALVSLLPELRCETFWEQVVQPLGGIVLMQSFPLDRVHRASSRLAFANGQYILVRRDAYDAAGGHAAVRERFVEDIALAERVKALGLPIRVALVRGIVTCRMYASLGQLVRGWARILFDALGRSTPRLLARLLDVIVFNQSGQLALLAGLIGLAVAIGRGGDPAFALVLLALAISHHFWMYLVFRLVYRSSVPGSRYVAWFPLGNLVIDVVLLRSLRMCLTGRVKWRGTVYGVAADQVERLESRVAEAPGRAHRAR